MDQHVHCQSILGASREQDERILTWDVAKEARRQRLPTRVCGWVAGANELDAVKPHPHMVPFAPIASPLHQLPEERHHPLRAKHVWVRQVDLIAEHHQPLSYGPGRKHHAIRCALCGHARLVRVRSGIRASHAHWYLILTVLV